MHKLRLILLIVLLIAAIADAAPTVAAPPPRQQTVSAPRHLLPYWGSWNTGEYQKRDGEDTGYHPDWQYDRIVAGSHLHPTFEFISDTLPERIRLTRAHYYEPLWSHARQTKLPLTFIGRNFGDMFRRLEPWASMTEQHPFVEYEDGSIQRRWLSPWNQNAHHWSALGRLIGAYLRKEYAQDYPDPPYVYLGDNNELGMCRLAEAMKDVALPEYLAGADRQLIIREMWDGYRMRRSLLIEGIREACPEWADEIHLFAYSDFGNEFCAVEQKADPYAYRYPWSGADGRLEFAGYHVTANVGYLHSWSNHSPHKVRSPQVEACNSRYALDRYRSAVNPAFELETHFWNGQNRDADVWQGVVRCVLWTMRTERNRLFLGASQSVSDTWENHMKPLVRAVEEVHRNRQLADFWQHGELLHNRWARDWRRFPATSKYDTQDGYGHPYHWPSVLPPEEQDPGRRWFLQRVPVNQRFVPWKTIGGPDNRLFDRWRNDRSHQTDVPVFAIALQREDRYLVYAHAPQGALREVNIEICPDGNEPRFSVTVDVPVEGGFWIFEAGETTPLQLQ